MSKAKPQIYIKSDSQLEREVLEELAWDSRVDRENVVVTANHGLIALTGVVNNYAKKMAAQEAAHRIPGVLDVVNDLKVIVPDQTERTDIAVAQAVRAALEWNVWLDQERIH